MRYCGMQYHPGKYGTSGWRLISLKIRDILSSGISFCVDGFIDDSNIPGDYYTIGSLVLTFSLVKNGLTMPL
jgi:hypothetical protein